MTFNKRITRSTAKKAAKTNCCITKLPLKQLPFFTLIFAMIAALTKPSDSSSLCPFGQTLKLPYRQHVCSTDDNIFSYVNDSEMKYCSKPKRENSYNCKCSTWTTECSFYHLSTNQRTSPTPDDDSRFILRHQPPICSFLPSNNCSDRKIYGIFHQIESNCTTDHDFSCKTFMSGRKRSLDTAIHTAPSVIVQS